MLKQDQAEAKENKHFFFIASLTFRLSNHSKYVFTRWWGKDEPLVGGRVPCCLSLCSHSIKSGLHRCHSASFVSHCLPINRHLLFFPWWPLFVPFVLNECTATQWLIHGRNDESLGGVVNEWNTSSAHLLCVSVVCVSVCARTCSVWSLSWLRCSSDWGWDPSPVKRLQWRAGYELKTIWPIWVIWVDSWGESAFLCYLLRKATIICPADPAEDQQRLITAVNYINVSCLFSLSECRYVKTTEALIVFFVCFFFIALTSALSCVGPQSGAPASPNVSGKTGIWSCNLPDASRGRSHRSQLEERAKGNKKREKKVKC